MSSSISSVLALFVCCVCLTKTACGELEKAKDTRDAEITISHTFTVTQTLESNGRERPDVMGGFPPGRPPCMHDCGDQGGPPPPPSGDISPVFPTPSGGEDFTGPSMGDRCPPGLVNENGYYPFFCYDVIDENGGCIMDDMMLDRQQCIDAFGQEFYDQQVATQEEINKNRSQALDQGLGVPDLPTGNPVQLPETGEENGNVVVIDDAGSSSQDSGSDSASANGDEGASSEGSDSNETQPDPVQEEKIEAEGRRRSVGSKRSPDLPTMNVGTINQWHDTKHLPVIAPPPGSYLINQGGGTRRNVGNRRSPDGPNFNMGALNSWDANKHRPKVTPPPGVYIGQGRRRSPDGPNFNMGALISWDANKHRPKVTPPPGVYIGQGRRRSPDGPNFNMGALNSWDANKHRPKVTPPPGVYIGQGRRRSFLSKSEETKRTPDGPNMLGGNLNQVGYMQGQGSLLTPEEAQYNQGSQNGLHNWY